MHSTLATKAAIDAWVNAPAHVKLMAGPYMRPVLSALEALAGQTELQAQQIKRLEAAIGYHP